MIKKLILCVLMAIINTTEVHAGNLCPGGEKKMPDVKVVDLDFHFRNLSKHTFQLEAKNITAQVISFQSNFQELYNIPEIGSPIGNNVRIHLRFKTPENQVFMGSQSFRTAGGVPDILVFNNGKQKQIPDPNNPSQQIDNPEHAAFILKLYPVIIADDNPEIQCFGSVFPKIRSTNSMSQNSFFEVLDKI